MNPKVPCCQHLKSGDPSPFELTVFGWYDGPTSGFAVCSGCDRVYHFELIATDEEVGERVYAFKEVSRASYDAVIAADASTRGGDTQQWADQVTLRTRDSLATGFERDLFVLTSDLQSSITAISRISVPRWRQILLPDS
jgi:hypothetical protein